MVSVGPKVMSGGTVRVGDQLLAAGDAVMITDAESVVLSDGEGAEVLAFDLP